MFEKQKLLFYTDELICLLSIRAWIPKWMGDENFFVHHGKSCLSSEFYKGPSPPWTLFDCEGWRGKSWPAIVRQKRLCQQSAFYSQHSTSRLMIENSTNENKASNIVLLAPTTKSKIWTHVTFRTNIVNVDKSTIKDKMICLFVSLI